MKCITCGENEAINDFYKECEGCIIEFEREEESEILGAKERNGEHTVPEIRRHPEVNVEIQPNSKDSFWSSYPTSELTPEQRRHFKTIMRKEVRK